PLVWIGVGAAVVLSIIAGASLTFIWDNIDSFYQQELLGGTLSILAVGFVTWMIFWMRRTARFLKKDLDAKLEQAMTLGPLAVVVASFLAVVREGLETTLFFWSATQAAGQKGGPLTGFLIGIAVAIVLGWLIYRSAVKINLSKFFTYTGIGLIVVAAGILGYGVYDLQEIEILPGLSSVALDLTAWHDETKWYGTLLSGIFNIKPTMSTLQVAAYVSYLAIVLAIFLWPTKGQSKPPSKKEEKPAESSEAKPASPEATPTPAQ
ncbi:MAG: iron transporter, partial [Corynebacteriales bacterium]|nr:iron transporter [Mycobacteriales bacterium]